MPHSGKTQECCGGVVPETDGLTSLLWLCRGHWVLAQALAPVRLAGKYTYCRPRLLKTWLHLGKQLGETMSSVIACTSPPLVSPGSWHGMSSPSEAVVRRAGLAVVLDMLRAVWKTGCESVGCKQSWG